jgi:hypothetical protein
MDDSGLPVGQHFQNRLFIEAYDRHGFYAYLSLSITARR